MAARSRTGPDIQLQGQRIQDVGVSQAGEDLVSNRGNDE